MAWPDYLWTRPRMYVLYVRRACQHGGALWESMPSHVADRSSVAMSALTQVAHAAASLISVLSLNVFVILLILKLDTSDLLRKWSWALVMLPIFIAGAMASLAATMQAYDSPSEETRPLLAKGDPNDHQSLSSLVDRMTPSSITRYYQADVFMQLAVLVALVFAAAIAVLVQHDSCACSTVVPTLVGVLAAIYVVRGVATVLSVRASYQGYSNLVTAVSMYHITPNARRLMDFGRWHISSKASPGRRLVSTVQVSGTVSTILIGALATYQIRHDQCVCSRLQTFSIVRRLTFMIADVVLSRSVRANAAHVVR